jgi:hypothetical protein
MSKGREPLPLPKAKYPQRKYLKYVSSQVLTKEIFQIVFFAVARPCSIGRRKITLWKNMLLLFSGSILKTEAVCSSEKPYQLTIAYYMVPPSRTP